MARPTNDPKSRVIKVRVNEEIAERLADIGNVSEYVRSCVERSFGKPEENSFVPHENHGEIHQVDVSDAVWDDLGTMMRLSGGTIGSLLEIFDRQLEDGSVLYEDGRLKGQSEYDLSRFLDACTDKGVDPQTMIDKMTQNIYRS